MGTKLYQRQGGNLQGKGITNPDEPSGMFSAVMDTASSIMGKLSQENYALGLKAAQIQALDSAYKLAPDSVERFTKAYGDAMKDLGGNLEGGLKNKFTEDMNKSFLVYQNKVIKNNVAKLDNEHTQGIINNLQAQSSLRGNAWSMMFQALSDNSLSPEERQLGFNEAKSLYDNTTESINKLSKSKTVSGKNVLSKQDIQDAMLGNSADKLKLMTEIVDSKNINELKDFYKTILERPDFESVAELQTKDANAIKKYVKNKIDTFDKGYSSKENLFKLDQSIEDATQLEVKGNLPDILESLRESKLIDDNLINQIEETNVKFDKLDPNKKETATSFLDSMLILKNINATTPTTPEIRVQNIQAGATTLARLADYAEQYGIAPEKLKTIRQSVVNMQANTEYRDLIKSFSNMIPKQSFTSSLLNSFKPTIGSAEHFMALEKNLELNEALHQSVELANQAIVIASQSDDSELANNLLKEIKKDTMIKVAKIRNKGLIGDNDIDDWLKDPEKKFVSKNGVPYKIVSIADDGTLNYEKLY